MDISDPAVFWSTKFSTPKSTFGTSEKDVRPASPPDPVPEKLADSWMSNERSGKTAGRLRVKSSHSGLLYEKDTNDHDAHTYDKSIRKSAYRYSLSSRHKVYDPPSFPAPNAYVIKSAFEMKKPYAEQMSKESARNEAPVRNRHLGPGTYRLEEDHKLSRYERVIEAKLKPKEVIVPRTTISTTNLHITTNYNTDIYKEMDRSDSPGPGEYDVSEDPRKIVKPKTFGQRTMLLGQKEVIKPGPGDYAIDRANPLGGPNHLSTSSKRIAQLKPLINPSADPDNMTTLLNKKVWAKHKSDYSFPKKVLPRMKKGQVFYSTVQNMPQYHAGKNSSGGHIRLERR